MRNECPGLAGGTQGASRRISGWSCGPVLKQNPEGFEVFAVTADMGVRAWGKDLPEVFANAARGMWSLMVEPGRAPRREMLPGTVEGGGRGNPPVGGVAER